MFWYVRPKKNLATLFLTAFKIPDEALFLLLFAAAAMKALSKQMLSE
jgi:hypothetical protein